MGTFTYMCWVATVFVLFFYGCFYDWSQRSQQSRETTNSSSFPIIIAPFSFLPRFGAAMVKLGRRNGWTDEGWTDGRMDGWTDRRTDRRMDRRTDRRTDGYENSFDMQLNNVSGRQGI
jgi:hypothetical protein